MQLFFETVFRLQPGVAPSSRPQSTALAALGLAALGLSLAACSVDQRCFRNEDCKAGEICAVDGRCVAAGLDLGRTDGTLPIQCPADMANILETFCIDVYEASRPDATAGSAGSDSSKATSREGVLPWQVSSNAEADGACQAAGKRLCSPAEWQTACQGPDQTVYAYGDSYDPKICNGINSFEEWQFHLMPTGSFPGCTHAWGVFDLNGNVWEHVAGGSARTIRGGAYNCGDSEKYHRCDYIPGNWEPSARGFRCCSDGMPVARDAGPADLERSEAGDVGADAATDAATDAGLKDAGQDGPVGDAQAAGLSDGPAADASTADALPIDIATALG